MASLIHALKTAYHLNKWRRTLRRASPPAAADGEPDRPDTGSRTHGQGSPAAGAIPRIIWMYWDQPARPPFVELCLRNIRRLHPHFDVRVLGPDDLPRYVPRPHPALAGVSVHQRADWLRLDLLKHHGGIWLDASTILTQPLDWVLQQQAASRSEFVGYYIEEFTRQPRFPVVENWFMAAVPGSAFIGDWQRAFTAAVLDGSADQYLQQLRQAGRYEQVVQGIGQPRYLSMHVCCQDILQPRFPYRLSLQSAERSAFFLQVRSHWRRQALHLNLLAFPCPPAPPPLVKLRSMDRKYLDAYIRHGLYRPDSLVGRLIASNDGQARGGAAPARQHALR